MKVCTKCKIEKDGSAFRWENKWNRFRSWCKQCDKEKGEEWRRKKGIKPQHRKREDNIPIIKTCTRCLIEKPNTEG